MALAVLVPKKGADTHVVARVGAFMRELGCGSMTVIVKGDQEGANHVDVVGRVVRAGERHQGQAGCTAAEAA